MQIDPVVTLRIPAQGAYVVLVRAAVQAMCARLNFSIDRIEDVKLAVNEATALLLADVPEAAELDVRLAPDDPEGLSVELSAATIHGRSLERDSFTWTVLTALVDDVVATVTADRRLRISLAVHREEALRP